MPTPAQLIEELKKLPQDKLIYCQVVGTEPNSGAWSMCYEFLESDNFKAGVILNITHPNLKRLTPEVVMEINK